MLKTEEIQIDGFDVRITQHRAREAAKLLAKVGRAVGPSLAKLGAGNTLRESDVADIGPAIGALFGALDGDQFDALLAEVFRHATIAMPDADDKLRVFDLSKPNEVDAAFTGRLPLMFKVARAVLEVNFGGFFAASGALGAIVASARAAS